MSMTDSAVFRNVKTQDTVSVAVATNSIGAPGDRVILDVKSTGVAKEPRHEAACPDGAKALQK